MVSLPNHPFTMKIKKQTRIQNSSSPKLFFLFQRSKILGLILVVDGDILKSSGNIC